MPDGPTKALAFVQNCYVFNYLAGGVVALHRRVKIGPFIGGGIGELENHVYRGKPAPPIRMRGVFVQSGDLNIELVEILVSVANIRSKRALLFETSGQAARLLN
jgi:hypothetical protein